MIDRSISLAVIGEWWGGEDKSLGKHVTFVLKNQLL